jgi:hypothetical protein
MAQTAPSESHPWRRPGDDESLSLLRFRLMQLEIAAVTVFVTAWFCTLGPVPAIIAARCQARASNRVGHEERRGREKWNGVAVPKIF